MLGDFVKFFDNTRRAIFGDRDAEYAEAVKRQVEATNAAIDAQGKLLALRKQDWPAPCAGWSPVRPCTGRSGSPRARPPPVFCWR